MSIFIRYLKSKYVFQPNYEEKLDLSNKIGFIRSGFSIAFTGLCIEENRIFVFLFVRDSFFTIFPPIANFPTTGYDYPLPLTVFAYFRIRLGSGDAKAIRKKNYRSKIRFHREHTNRYIVTELVRPTELKQCSDLILLVKRKSVIYFVVLLQNWNYSFVFCQSFALIRRC